jgi:hypothetical protein
MRFVTIVVAIALAVPACTAGREGPTEPAEAGDLDVDDAVRAAGARWAARAFVEAYAGAPADDGAGLRPLVGTPLLRRWAGWLQVQNEGFPGAIAGDVDAVRIGPAVPFEVESVPGSAEILREVDVRASITFAFEPRDGDPFSVTRSLDGPMRLIRGSEGDWSVLDFTRDSVPLSSQFEAVSDAGDRDAGVTVAIAAFFAAPTWQFGLVVQTAGPLSLGSDDVTLVDDDGGLVATAGAITTQLERIRAGATVRGLVAFEPRSSADGLFLRLAVRGSRGRSTLVIPLAGRIHPIEVTGGTGAESPTPSPSQVG